MKHILILAVLVAPGIAFAEPPPEMVLIPKALAEAATTLISRDPAVQIRDSLVACLSSNADKPPAHDACATVTAALKAQRDALAEARKGAASTEPKPPGETK